MSVLRRSPVEQAVAEFLATKGYAPYASHICKAFVGAQYPESEGSARWGRCLTRRWRSSCRRRGAKWRSYKGALARQEAGGPGWLTKSMMKQTDVFVPFAFEVGGAMGDESEDFLSEAAKVAEHCRRGVAMHQRLGSQGVSDRRHLH